MGDPPKIRIENEFSAIGERVWKCVRRTTPELIALL
jgi:hypothetical protein